MADEIALHKKLEDAARAEAYLRDPFLQERQQARIAELFDAWTKTAPRDNEGREFLFRQYHEAKKRWDDLQLIAAAGRLAQAELNMLAQQRPDLKIV